MRKFIVLLFSLSLLFGCNKNEISAVLAELSTLEITEITSNSANSGGNILSDGGASITTRGLCWSKEKNPTTADLRTIDGEGMGSFSSMMTGLESSTEYFVRAYAVNEAGTAYGNELSFTSLLDCALICDVNTESYSLSISCEEGGYSTSFHNESTSYEYDNNGTLVGLTLNLNQTRTYLASGNIYTITGMIEVDLVNDTVSYNIIVSGGLFVEEQSCN